MTLVQEGRVVPPPHAPSVNKQVVWKVAELLSAQHATVTLVNLAATSRAVCDTVGELVWAHVYVTDDGDRACLESFSQRYPRVIRVDDEERCKFAYKYARVLTVHGRPQFVPKHKLRCFIGWFKNLQAVELFIKEPVDLALVDDTKAPLALSVPTHLFKLVHSKRIETLRLVERGRGVTQVFQLPLATCRAKRLELHTIGPPMLENVLHKHPTITALKVRPHSILDYGSLSPRVDELSVRDLLTVELSPNDLVTKPVRMPTLRSLDVETCTGRIFKQVSPQHLARLKIAMQPHSPMESVMNRTAGFVGQLRHLHLINFPYGALRPFLEENGRLAVLILEKQSPQELANLDVLRLLLRGLARFDLQLASIDVRNFNASDVRLLEYCQAKELYISHPVRVGTAWCKVHGGTIHVDGYPLDTHGAMWVKKNTTVL